MKIFDVKRRKKASLELSINSIVILILAITMLGLGLTFMRGLFKQISTKVSESVSANELTNPPTTDNPMTVAPSEITLRQGENSKVTLAFLNVVTSRPISDCVIDSIAFTGGVIVAANRQFSNAVLKMAKDQINTWTISVTAPGSTTGVTLLTAKMLCCDNAATPGTCPLGEANQFSFTKDFIVTVTT